MSTKDDTKSKFKLIHLEDLVQNDSNEKKRSRISKRLHTFLLDKKQEMQETKFRKQFDALFGQANANLIDTNDMNPANGSVVGASVNFKPIFFQTPAGGVDYTMRYNASDSDASTTSVPCVKEPIIFSKIWGGVSLMFSRAPDAKFESDDKIWAQANHDMWARTWKNNMGNALQALQSVGFNTFTFGWGAMKTYYREITRPILSESGEIIEKIVFDDVYREALDLDRTWMGAGARFNDIFSQNEFLYEQDILIDDFVYLMRKSGVKKLDDKMINYKTEISNDKKSDVDALSDKIVQSVLDEGGTGVTQESETQDPQRSKTHVTFTFYENEMTNVLIVMCGCYIIYKGPLQSPDGMSSISVTNLYGRINSDPHGVGFFEMARGNEQLVHHMQFLTPQQVEAELTPVILAKQGNSQGTQTFIRRPGIINNVNAAAGIEVVRTTGNVPGAMNYIISQRDSLTRLTLSDTIMGEGVENTLGSTVIQKEASQQKLLPAKNSLLSMVERDAYLCVTLFDKFYSVDKIRKFDDIGVMEEFIARNPDYTSVIKEPTEEQEKYEVLLSRNIGVPFSIKRIQPEEGKEQSEDDPTHTIEEANPQDGMFATNRRSYMQNLKEYTEVNPIARALIIEADGNSLLQPSDEVNQQKVMSLAPMVNNMTQQAMQASRQDPELGMVLMKQLVELLTTMKVDPYKWLPKEIVNKVFSGELVDEQMVNLARQNQAAALQEQLGQTGVSQPEPLNNQPQTPDGMRDAVNGSIAKLR